jgi:hypothetical protein
MPDLLSHCFAARFYVSGSVSENVRLDIPDGD